MHRPHSATSQKKKKPLTSFLLPQFRRKFEKVQKFPKWSTKIMGQGPYPFIPTVHIIKLFIESSFMLAYNQIEEFFKIIMSFLGSFNAHRPQSESKELKKKKKKILKCLILQGEPLIDPDRGRLDRRHSNDHDYQSLDIDADIIEIF